MTGHVSATNGGQALANLAVVIDGATTATSDSGGTFRATLAGPGPRTIDLTGPTIVPRHLQLFIAASRDLAVDAFTPGPTFDLAYYRKIARNGFDEPGHLRPIEHLLQAPRVYLRTIDEAGQPIDGTTLNVAENTIRATDSLWSGGRFGIVDVERGTDTRRNVSGWLTVRWLNPPEAGVCGRADVAGVGGVIDLNPLGERCGCGGSRIAPLTVRHELGHAFGLYHSGDPEDVMSGIGSAACDMLPSARERQYVNYIYSRQNGNTDPDFDVNAPVALTPLRVR